MSLVEIFVTLFIVAMLIGLVAPSTATWIQNLQLRNAADSVLSGVQQAKVEALKRNTFVSFQLTDAASTAYTICLFDPINNVCSTAAGSTIATKSAVDSSTNAKLGVDTVLSDTSVPIAPTTNLPGQLTFDAFGRLAATAPNNVMRIDVRNTKLSTADERRMVILINNTGQIRMCDPRLTKAVNPQGCA
jgi:type IV fimbrial biogenesis protein FimT